MYNQLTLNDGTVLTGDAILSGSLFLYIYGKTMRQVFDLLEVPENTERILLTRGPGDNVLFDGYTKLTAVSDDGDGLVTAVLTKGAE